MLAEKTPHSIFVPELVLAALLPERFPGWKRCVQVESLQWILQAMGRFFEPPQRSGCILSADNQLLHDREIGDSEQLARWASSSVRARVCESSARDILFCEVAVAVRNPFALPRNRTAAERAWPWPCPWRAAAWGRPARRRAEIPCLGRK